MKKYFRWLFRRCMDCGRKLDHSYDRGDVCEECFNAFDGMTIEELTASIAQDLHDKNNGTEGRSRHPH